MHSCVTSKNVKWCHLIWPTLYINIVGLPAWTVKKLHRKKSQLENIVKYQINWCVNFSYKFNRVRNAYSSSRQWQGSTE